MRAAARADAFVVHRQPEPSRVPADLRAPSLVEDGTTDGIHPHLLAEVDGPPCEVDEGGDTARHLSNTRHGHAEQSRTAKIPVLDQDDIRDLVHDLLGHRRTRVAGVEDRSTQLPELCQKSGPPGPPDSHFTGPVGAPNPIDCVCRAMSSAISVVSKTVPAGGFPVHSLRSMTWPVASFRTAASPLYTCLSRPRKSLSPSFVPLLE